MSFDSCHGLVSALIQKNPRVRKIRVRNSGAGNGCANFMDARKKCVLSAGKPVSIKFLVLGGGVFWVWGGGSADFIFMGARIFLINLAAKHLRLVASLHVFVSEYGQRRLHKHCHSLSQPILW